MGASRVVAPDGREWRVGRRWVGDHPRLRRRDRDPDLDAGGDGGWWSDVLDFGLDDITPGAILSALAFAIVLAFLFTVAWPLLAIALEVVLVVVLAVAGLVGRLLFRRPWTVEARTADGCVRWRVSGWRASGALVQRIRDRLAAGENAFLIETGLRDENQLDVR